MKTCEELLARLKELHSTRASNNLCEYCGRVYPCEELKLLREYEEKK
jgi:hypothetical protein